jgi:uncharacterized membrane protein
MSDSDLVIPRSKKPWFLTFVGFLAAGGLIALPFLVGPAGKHEMPDLIRFFGHFHPVLLHLPIGVFVLITLQELGAIFSKPKVEPRSTSLFPLFFGVASAILAVLAGFSLYHGHSEEYGTSLVAERHLWGGLIFAVAAVVTFVLKAWSISRGVNSAFYRALLFASVGIMGFTSHDGASMTHGADYLTIYAPEPIRRFMGLPVKKKEDVKNSSNEPAKAAGQQLVYADLVAPIFERRCVQCHKESKSKGKFRMDTYELLVKGGKEGAGLVAGKSAESSIVIRMELPKDDEEHMPPEGKSPVEDSELAVIKWWIDHGADPQKAVTDFVIPEPIKAAISMLVPAAAVGVSKAAQEGVNATSHAELKHPDEKLKSAVASLSEEFPGALSFESQQSELVSFTAVSIRANFDDTAFNKLTPVLSQLVTADLSATKVTDQSVSQLVVAKSLRLIRLSETEITDASINALLKLPELESINLYNTKVTDAGISKLSIMPKLKRLYLWKTMVTPDAIKVLKEKLPSCEIITGI